MGIDISGMVEVRPWATWPDRPSEVAWEAAISLDFSNVTRDYDAFGCLFGVMNFAGFLPVEADRGVPDDASSEVQSTVDALRAHDPEHSALWPTWISWEEITGIDWDEPAERADARLHEYVRDGHGGWAFRGKAAHSPQAFRAQGLRVPPASSEPTIWPVGSTWTVDDVQFRAERLTRRDAIPVGSSWQPVWEAMGLLARLHDNQCRLIVWFDR